MNVYFALSSVLAIALGVLHCVIGERLIFSRLAAATNRTTLENMGLSPRRVRALRSTWHLLSIFGWGFAALFMVLSLPTPATAQVVMIKYTLAAMFALSTVFWVVGTKGRHPAWVILLVITCCVGLA